MCRKITKAIPAVIVSLILSLLPLAPALADPVTPDKLEIKSVNIFRNLAETGDMFLAARINIQYFSDNDTPTDTADETFIARLLDTDGVTELGATVPFVYYNGGYDNSFVSIYWDNTTAPTWGMSYTFNIVGNPGVWTTPPTVSHTMNSSEWETSSNTTQNQQDLATYMIAVAHKLESNWSKTLTVAIDTGTVLNPTGELYFRGTTPGLQILAPDIFSLTSGYPSYPTRTATGAQSTIYTNRWIGSAVGAWINDYLSVPFYGYTIPGTMVTGLAVLIIVAVCLAFSQIKYQRQEPGWIAGGIAFIGCSIIGMVHLALVAVVGLFMIMFLGRTFLFREGS